MCWISIEAKQLIATKDIETFKMLYRTDDGRLWSPFRCRFEYVLNKENQRIPITVGNPCSSGCTLFTIDAGYHSYHTKCATLNFSHVLEVWNSHKNSRRRCLCFYSTSISEFIRINKRWVSGHLVKIKCIIPETSVYYVNKNGEIVSEQLIAKEIIEKY